MSARSVSAWDCTDTYSPAAIDIAPAANPAMPAVSTADGAAPVAATPTIRLAVDITPSFAPSTAARNQPMREALCHSSWRCGMRAILQGWSDIRFRRRARATGQPEGIADHRHRAQAHRQRRDHGAQQDVEHGVQHPRRDRHADGVVDEREAKV